MVLVWTRMRKWKGCFVTTPPSALFFWSARKTVITSTVQSPIITRQQKKTTKASKKQGIRVYQQLFSDFNHVSFSSYKSNVTKFIAPYCKQQYFGNKGRTTTLRCLSSFFHAHEGRHQDGEFGNIQRTRSTSCQGTKWISRMGWKACRTTAESGQVASHTKRRGRRTRNIEVPQVESTNSYPRKQRREFNLRIKNIECNWSDIFALLMHDCCGCPCLRLLLYLLL